ncbi:MAG: molybdenum cofactor guanylyltransferase [Bacteroidales bacterium]|nr:molybdenum cofactor guanylyltransferase [Bacteroidales bacterium]
MAIHDHRIAGVILAGGRSSRMIDPLASAGKIDPLPKPRQTLAGKLLIDHVAERLRPQVSCLLINANDDPAAYRHLAAPVVADLGAGYRGPLAGLACAMSYLHRQHPLIELVALAPCDAPFLPENLVAVLAEALFADSAQVACPRYEGFLQPTFSLWRMKLLPVVLHESVTLDKGGIKELLCRLRCAAVEWPQSTPHPFFNINTPEQLEEAGTLLESGPISENPMRRGTST